MSPDGLNRRWFISLPYAVSTEVMATWLRLEGIREFDRKTIQRLVVAAKTGIPGKRVDVVTARVLHIGKHHLTFSTH